MDFEHLTYSDKRYTHIRRLNVPSMIMLHTFIISQEYVRSTGEVSIINEAVSPSQLVSAFREFELYSVYQLK